MHRSEMGQGVHTALAMLVAEELDVPLDRVRLIPAGPDRLYGNVSMVVAVLPLHPSRDRDRPRDAAGDGRPVGRREGRARARHQRHRRLVERRRRLGRAAARRGDGAARQLVNAASLQWKLPAAELVVANGVVSHPSGPLAHYGELAKRRRRDAARRRSRLQAREPTGGSSARPRRGSTLPAKVDGTRASSASTCAARPCCTRSCATAR